MGNMFWTLAAECRGGVGGSTARKQDKDVPQMDAVVVSNNRGRRVSLSIAQPVNQLLDHFNGLVVACADWYDNVFHMLMWLCHMTLWKKLNHIILIKCLRRGEQQLIVHSSTLNGYIECMYIQIGHIIMVNRDSMVPRYKIANNGVNRFSKESKYPKKVEK